MRKRRSGNFSMPQLGCVLLVMLISISSVHAIDQKWVNFAQNHGSTDEMALTDPKAAPKSKQPKQTLTQKTPTTKKPVSPVKKVVSKPAAKGKPTKPTKKGAVKSKGGKKPTKQIKGQKKTGKLTPEGKKNLKKSSKLNKKNKSLKKKGALKRKRKIRYYHKPSANVTRYLHNLTVMEEKKHSQILKNLTKTEQTLGKIEKRVDQLGMRNFRLHMRKQVHKLLDKLQYKGNVKIMIRRDPPKDPLDFRGEMRNAEDRSPIHHKMNDIMSKGNVPLKKLIHSLEPKVSKKSPTLKDRFSKRWKKKPNKLKKPESATPLASKAVKPMPLATSKSPKVTKKRMRGRRVHRRYRNGLKTKFYEIDSDTIEKSNKFPQPKPIFTNHKNKKITPRKSSKNKPKSSPKKKNPQTGSKPSSTSQANSASPPKPPALTKS